MLLSLGYNSHDALAVLFGYVMVSGGTYST